MKKIVSLLHVFLFACMLTQGQQHVLLSQYSFNSLGINPAYAGYREQWSAQLAFRTQWTGWEGAPKIAQLAIDGLLDPVDRRHGVGFQFNSDRIGVQNTVSAYGSYAFRLQLDPYGEQRLSLGFSGGVARYGLDGNGLRATDGISIDESIPRGFINTWKPDLRLGLHYADNRLYAGFSVQDIFAGGDNEEDFQFAQSAFERITRRTQVYLMAGGVFPIERAVLLKSGVLIRDESKGLTTIDVHAMLIFNDAFWLGGSYRRRGRVFDRDYSAYNRLGATSSVSAITQFKVNERFRLGYAYDHLLNKIGDLQHGSHEVTLTMLFRQKKFSPPREPKYF